MRLQAAQRIGDCRLRRARATASPCCTAARADWTSLTAWVAPAAGVPCDARFGCSGRAHTCFICMRALSRRLYICIHVHATPSTGFLVHTCSVQKGAAGSAAVTARRLLGQAPQRGPLLKRPRMHARAAAAGRAAGPRAFLNCTQWRPEHGRHQRLVCCARIVARGVRRLCHLCCGSALVAGRHFVASRCACLVRPPVCCCARCGHAVPALSGWRRMRLALFLLPRALARGQRMASMQALESAPATRYWTRPACSRSSHSCGRFPRQSCR